MLSRTRQFQISWPAFVQHFVQNIVNVGVRNVTAAATFNVELNRPGRDAGKNSLPRKIYDLALVENLEKVANLNSQPVSGSVGIRTHFKKDGASCETRTMKTSANSHFFEIMSKRRKGFPSETQVKRGERVVHGNKVLEEKLGRNDLCLCGSGQRFKKCCLKNGCF